MSDEHAGRYTTGDEIARGGMGRVVEATDTVLNRIVAVKEALVTDPEMVRRFRRETQITARLEHPSIVPVYDAGTLADGAPYYVMRKVSGRPLEELVGAAAGLDDRLALLPHVVAAAQAIAHAHSRGVIHRDLKPTNILVGGFGETVVIDWGLAKVIGEPDDPSRSSGRAIDPASSLQTRSGVVLGTPGFMSPEQLHAEEVDERADVYALGATLYYLLSREPPHAAATGDEMMSKAALGPPTPIGKLVDGIPAALSTIVDKALAYDARIRYPNAGAFTDELQRFCAGQLVASHHYSRRERLARFVRRNRGPVVIAVVASAVLAVGAWIAIGRVVAARDEAVAQAEVANEARGREAVARQNAIDRADELMISQARLLLDTNPTAAVALLKPLASTARWRDVRDVAAAARARGVAYRLPASEETRSVRISPDGHHAASVGSDDVLRFYDLDRRTARNVGNLKETFFDFVDDTHIAVFETAQIEIIDLATSARRAIPFPAHGVPSNPASGVLYWTSVDHRVWRLDAGSDTPTRLAVDDEIREVLPSPDGKRLALLGEKAIWIHEAGVAKRLVGQPAGVAAWDTDGQHLAFAPDGKGSVESVALADPTKSTRLIGSIVTIRIVMTRGHVFAQGPNGFANDLGQVKSFALGVALKIAGAWNGLVVGAGTNGELVIADLDRSQTLASPVPRLDGIATRVGSPYIVTSSGSDVLLWNLEAIFPQRISVLDSRYQNVQRVGPHHVLSGRLDGSSTWIDLQTRKELPGPPMTPSMRAMSDRSGTRTLLFDLSGKVSATRYGTQSASELATDVVVISFVDQHRVLLGHTGGDVELRDLDRPGTKPILGGGAPLRFVLPSANGEWLVIARQDDTAVRIELATGRLAKLDQASWTRRLAAITNDGRVWFSEADELRSWRTDGSIARQATLPGEVTTVLAVDDAHVTVDTDDAGYIVDLDRPESIRATARLQQVSRYNANAATFWLVPPATNLIGVRDTQRGLTVIDGVTGVAWSVGQTGSSSIGLTNDGTLAYEFRPTEIAVWNVALPATQAATVTMLDELTNATIDSKTSQLRWK